MYAITEQKENEKKVSFLGRLLRIIVLLLVMNVMMVIYGHDREKKCYWDSFNERERELRERVEMMISDKPIHTILAINMYVKSDQAR